MSKRLVIAITPGEPAGIGPELAIVLARQPSTVRRVLIADRDLIAATAQRLGLAIQLQNYDRSASPGADVTECLHVPLSRTAQAGRLDIANAGYVLATLEQAVDGCLSKAFDAVVTGPVHKGVINDAGIPFSGHTEFLAQRTRTPHVVMMLANATLRVALATTHLPLRQVPAAISKASLTATIRIMYHDLIARFAIPKPRVVVCGLNPHAGEGGHLGQEEIDVIEPTVQTLRATGMDLLGPLPADTAFTPSALQRVDAVLAMYHDQGLPVIKHAGFERTVNVTLGLPIIRTSVDHGTAIDLAGQGIANVGSFQSAFDMAIALCQRGGRADNDATTA